MVGVVFGAQHGAVGERLDDVQLPHATSGALAMDLDDLAFPQGPRLGVGHGCSS
jgi:hypothetical protein